MKIALYHFRRDGWLGVADRLIGFFLQSRYTHIELIFSDGMSASSSWQDGGVRVKNIPEDFDRWEYSTLPDVYDEDYARAWFHANQDCLYDYMGAAGVVAKLFRVATGKWFCCSSIQTALQVPGDVRIAPEDLARKLVDRK